MPTKRLGVRVCIAVSKNGVTVYGNREAFASLSEWMTWIASSPPTEHFECHVIMDLEDEASKFEGSLPRNAWVLLDDAMRDVAESKAGDFELTFMALEEDELAKLSEYQGQGRLPEGWNRE